MAQNTKPIKEIFYENEFHDDFAETKINTKNLPPDFKYVHRNIFWRFFSWILYYLVAVPVIFLITKIWYGVRVKNKKAIKKLKGTGFFLYANHTAMMDGTIHSVLIAKHRPYIIANPDAVSLKGLSNFVVMVGCLPLGNSPENQDALDAALHHRVIEQKRAVIVFPEAHIWKYYNKIRTLRPATFRFAAKLNAPVLPVTTTWRKPHWPFKKPRMTLNVGEPIFYDPEQSLSSKCRYLAATCQQIMNDISNVPDNYEYIRYTKVNKND